MTELAGTVMIPTALMTMPVPDLWADHQQKQLVGPAALSVH